MPADITFASSIFTVFVSAIPNVKLSCLLFNPLVNVFIWTCILLFTPLKRPNSVSVIELTATFPIVSLIKALDGVKLDETIVDAAPSIVVPPLDTGLSTHNKLPLLYSKICPEVGAVVQVKLYVERPGEALLTGSFTSLALVINEKGCAHDNSPVAFVFK